MKIQPQLLTFISLSIGQTFRWRTLLGSGDSFLKTGPFTVRNCHTGREYNITSQTFYFNCTDAVITDIEEDPTPRLTRLTPKLEPPQ